MMAHYRIAGLAVQMDSFGRIAKQTEPYRCAEERPDIVIYSDWENLKNTGASEG